MYEELVKSLRQCAEASCAGCKNDLVEIGCRGKLQIEAADAIEELKREVEEYKAAYRKEHNKRIAENRYLYDELTKAVKEKLLMTPMQIEAPEPPKEAYDEN